MRIQHIKRIAKICWNWILRFVKVISGACWNRLVQFIKIVPWFMAAILLFLGLLLPSYFIVFSDKEKLMVDLLNVIAAPEVVIIAFSVWFVKLYKREIGELISRIRRLPFGIKLDPSERGHYELAGSIPTGTIFGDMLEKAYAGSMEEQLQLGLAYYFGEGVRKDAVEAVKWWRRAAEQGSVDAQYNLGMSYNSGDGVLQDDSEALKWYLNAAEHGHAKAQFNLGLSYYLGAGIKRNYKEATKWWHRAAEQEVAGAQYNLGLSYASGKGVKKNHATSTKWYSRAAELGHAKAQRNLGEKYANGQGVAQSWREAYIWSSIATASGAWSAAKLRDNAARKLSQSQLSSAQKKAEERYEEISPAT